MIRLPTTRLLPLTIVVTAVLLGLKTLSLGEAALASDPKSVTPNAPSAQPAPTKTTVADVASPPPNVTTAMSSAIPSSSVSISVPADWPLLRDLRNRRDALDRREHALDLRDAALQAASRTLELQLAKLGALKEKLETLEASRQQRSESDLLGLVKLYEAMKPNDAATIFNALDMHLLVQLLDRMNERKAAQVVGDMDPDRARLATQMLALHREHQDADPSVGNIVPDPARAAGPG